MPARAIENASMSLTQEIGSQFELERMKPCSQPAPTQALFGPPSMKYCRNHSVFRPVSHPRGARMTAGLWSEELIWMRMLSFSRSTPPRRSRCGWLALRLSGPG